MTPPSKPSSFGFRAVVMDGVGSSVFSERSVENFVKELHRATDIKDLLRIYIKEKPEIVIADFLSSSESINILKRIKMLNSSALAITYTKECAVSSLKEALNAGLDFYLTSPCDETMLQKTLELLSKKLLTHIQMQKENAKLKLAFNSSAHLVAMTNGRVIFSANKPFMNFFSIANLKNFDDFFSSFISPSSSSIKEGNWLQNIGSFSNRIVKIRNQSGSIREFLPRVDLLTQGKDIYLLSLTDVTGLFAGQKESVQKAQRAEVKQNISIATSLFSEKIVEIVQKEIYRNERYKSLFCILRVSANIIQNEGRILEKKSLTGIMERSINFQIRPTDISEKIGHCDFFILTPHTEPKGAEALVGRLKNDLLNDPKLLNYAIDFKFTIKAYEDEKDPTRLLEALEGMHEKTQAIKKLS